MDWGLFTLPWIDILRDDRNTAPNSKLNLNLMHSLSHTTLGDVFANLAMFSCTTLQSMMNVKLIQKRFGPCHDNRLINNTSTIPHSIIFKSATYSLLFNTSRGGLIREKWNFHPNPLIPAQSLSKSLSCLLLKPGLKPFLVTLKQ